MHNTHRFLVLVVPGIRLYFIYKSLVQLAFHEDTFAIPERNIVRVSLAQLVLSPSMEIAVGAKKQSVNIS